MAFRCPGQDKRNLKVEALTCPACGYTVELFSDEASTQCPQCRQKVSRSVAPSCIDWCKLAKECVGTAAYDTYVKNKSIAIKDKLIKEVESYWGRNADKLHYTGQVMEMAEELLRKSGGDWHIVVPAAILHEIGYGAQTPQGCSSADGSHPANEPCPAKKILSRLDFKKEDMDEICLILEKYHSSQILDTRNFKLVQDACRLVKIKNDKT
jgi:hypothetical protein